MNWGTDIEVWGDTSSIEEERKYSILYSSGYGHGPIDGLFSFGAKSASFSGVKRILDVGCGNGSGIELLLKNGFEVQGIDISSVAVEICKKKGLKATQIAIYDIPSLKDNFDLVWCCDVLEHLPPESIGASIHCIKTKSERCLFSISTRQSIAKYNGKGVHLTVRPSEWWKSMLSNCFSISKTKETIDSVLISTA
jgi:2-polyprenyl-3-methyl-5-hydroxy-6-metoxy-1,4-benzoquinol methylase